MCYDSAHLPESGICVEMEDLRQNGCPSRSRSRGLGRRPSRRGAVLFLFVANFCLFVQFAVAQPDSLERIRQRGELLWGGDAEGGAPYSFPDPSDPERLIGFEVEIAEELARRLGVSQRMIQAPWSTLPQALERGDFDIILNGLEVTPERKARIAFSEPYYEFHEALMVREDDDHIRDLQDLRGLRVGTLKGALAQNILQSVPGAELVLYEDNVSPYRDLALARLDAVLMDDPISRYYGEKVPGLKTVGREFGVGYYAIGVRKQDERLLDAINQQVAEIKLDGTLDSILERWGLVGHQSIQFQKSKLPLSAYLPLLLRAALMTVFLSVVSMALAVCVGLALCLARLYGPSLLEKVVIVYVEFFRGTPLLLQLLVIYFGLPAVGVALPAWMAGILGLTLNYAAYESEIYRGAITSIPHGQSEAALSLGMTRRLALRAVILPQALRVSLPASTNDFIALFKDSSLCSVIGVMELTKQFNILAISTWRVMELGILTGLLYLMMSYPLSLMARRWEARLAKGRRAK